MIRGVERRRSSSLAAPRGSSRWPTLLSGLVLLADLERHVPVLVEGQGDQVRAAADGAVLGEGLAPAATRVGEDLVVLTAERAGIRHDGRLIAASARSPRGRGRARHRAS